MSKTGDYPESDTTGTRRPRISVCMAAYNGAPFIREQIDSILVELYPDDELVIVDDKSDDDTVAIVEAIEDRRIRVIRAERNVGYVRTFERALAEAAGEVLFLSDQDDIWMPGRVTAMLEQLGDRLMVVSNCEHVGEGSGTFHGIRLREKDSTHHRRNIVGIVVGYRLHWGCAMAIRAELLDVALPFPAYMTESHDQYLAMAANVVRSVSYMEADTIWHRLHGTNLTPAGVRSFGRILRARWDFFRELATLLRRGRRVKDLSTIRPKLTPAQRRVGVVVTCYNPPRDLVERVAQWSEEIGPVVAIDDGSPARDDIVWQQLAEAGADVVRLPKNTGIANALNVGIERVRSQHDVDWILTMDQDSSLQPHYVTRAFAGLDAVGETERVGMLCSGSQNGFSVPLLESGLPVPESFDPMQSGTLVRAEMLDEIGSFRADFVIDAVDSEMNVRARENGWYLLASPGADLTHSLGKARPMRIFGKPVIRGGKPMMIFEHPPFRVYYITRNNILMAKKYWRRRPAWVAKRLMWEVQSHVIRFIFGPDRALNARAALAGTRDGVLGRSGMIPPRLQSRIQRR